MEVATGWGASYDVVVGVGDNTGDGEADLVSRDTSGTLWRNNGNGKGSFGTRTKIDTVGVEDVAVLEVRGAVRVVVVDVLAHGDLR